MRFVKQQELVSLLYKLVLLYPTPVNLTYLWNFGSLAGIALVIQVATGILLALWYIGSVDVAFASVEFIMREVNNGWFFRYLHANGASLFFVVVYIHITRGLFYGSYTHPREKVWYTGVIIFLMMIITAFLGYVLPWGQMSYWAATVITSLLSVVPFVGEKLLFFVWGGISIDQPTLTRVYGLHYLLPFILIALVGLHIIFLHEHGSNNYLGVRCLDFVSFHPYYSYKDLLGLMVALFFYLFVVINFPNAASHSDNYILADPGVTPTHIVPEWYFLPFYGILRSVPSKSGGVVLLISAILALLILPKISKPNIRSGAFRPVFAYGFEIFLLVWLILGWSGGNPIETPFYEICQLATALYFLFFFIFNPLVVELENIIYILYSLGQLHVVTASKMDISISQSPQNLYGSQVIFY
jgi:quinol-cytochrome oxidoreductase complex cytochrome b subunit